MPRSHSLWRCYRTNQVDFRNWHLCLLWSDTLNILTHPLELMNNVLFPAVNILSTLSSYSGEFQFAVVSLVVILALFSISVLADVAGDFILLLRWLNRNTGNVLSWNDQDWIAVINFLLSLSNWNVLFSAEQLSMVKEKLQMKCNICIAERLLVWLNSTFRSLLLDASELH